MSRSDSADPRAASSTPQPRRPQAGPASPRARRRRMLTIVLASLAAVVTVAAAGGLVWQIASVTQPRTGVFTQPEAYDPAEPEQVLASTDESAAVPDLASLDLFDSDALNGTLGVTFTDAVTGEVLYEQNGSTALTPASSMKLVTAVSALEQLGADYRIPTTVVEGPTEDSVVLVAGGDVTLTVDGEGYYTEYADGASLTELAEAVLEARSGDAPTTVYLDTSVFSDSTKAEGVPEGDLQTMTAPMDALMVDGGRTDSTEKYSVHYDDPAMAAAEEFADLLGASEVAEGTAESDADELATVYSAPMSALVDSFLLTSDNTLTDAVALQTALAVEGEMTWDAISTVHLATLEGLGVDTTGLVFYDGSGLSPQDKITTSAFTQLLEAAMGTEAASVFESLPVAGYSGTLGERFESAEEGQGVVRAKTGTLTGVSSLTGTITTADGRLLLFSLISNGHTTGDTAVEEAMDEITATVAQCGC